MQSTSGTPVFVVDGRGGKETGGEVRLVALAVAGRHIVTSLILVVWTKLAASASVHRRRLRRSAMLRSIFAANVESKALHLIYGHLET